MATPRFTFPFNAWAGTTVELAKYVSRLDALVRVPAEVRFISYEPVLGPIADELDAFLTANPGTIHWLIAGGESGHGPNRPIVIPAISWVRAVRDVCAKHGVAFYFKQHGGRTNHANGSNGARAEPGVDVTKVAKWKLPMLDGRVHADFPKPSADQTARIVKGFPRKVSETERLALLRPVTIPGAAWSPLRALGHKGLSDISWTDTIDKMGISGCRHVSEACEGCYAAVRHDALHILKDQLGPGDSRYKGYQSAFYDQVVVSAALMDATHHPANGRLVFASAMSDVFINEVDHVHVARMVERIEAYPQHTWQLLTKRPGRMASFFFA